MSKNGVFIITGATGGLGSALAHEISAAGHPLALVARTKTDLLHLQRKLRALHPKGAQITIHALDLTNEKRVIREFIAIAATHGSLRALINNAATWMGTATVEKLTSKLIRESLDLNFFSAFHATQAFLGVRPKNQKSALSIVNIGATSSLDCWAEVLPYCIAKGALRGLSRAYSRELGPRGVHIAHIVVDGMLDGDRTRKLNPSLAANRFIKTSSVAQTVLHLALQERSCWTAELDVRPFNESW